jgi:methyltransferase (TIGR00027 family)
VAFPIVIRTKFLDDLRDRAVASGVRQVVLLGAGTDSRAFRMDWPAGTRLFEVDAAEPLGFKASVLRQERAVPRSERITVPVDLREDGPGALAAAGHDPAQPTVWIADGLLIHLSEDAVQSLLERVGPLSAVRCRQQAAGSRQQDGSDTGARAVWSNASAGTPLRDRHFDVGLGDAGGPGRLAGPPRLGGGDFTLRERAEAYGRPVLTPSQQDEGTGGLVSAVRAAHWVVG